MSRNPFVLIFFRKTCKIFSPRNTRVSALIPAALPKMEPAILWCHMAGKFFPVELN